MLYLPSDHPTFDGASLLWTPPSHEDADERADRVQRLRAELLELFEGDTRTLNLLLDYYGSSCSAPDLATALGVHRATAWKRLQGCLRRCQCVRAAGLAVASFERGEAFVIDTPAGKLLRGVNCYAVPLRGQGRLFRRPLGREEMKTYVRRRGRLLQSETPKCYFCGWIGGDGFHLDVCLIVKDLNGAIARAAREGRPPIAGLTTGTAIPQIGCPSRHAA